MFLSAHHHHKTGGYSFPSIQEIEPKVGMSTPWGVGSFITLSHWYLVKYVAIIYSTIIYMSLWYEERYFPTFPAASFDCETCSRLAARRLSSPARIMTARNPSTTRVSTQEAQAEITTATNMLTTVSTILPSWGPVSWGWIVAMVTLRVHWCNLHSHAYGTVLVSKTLQ